MTNQEKDLKLTSKTLVIDVTNESAVPFLRGILTGSLADAGVPFKAAYKLATQIRHSIADKDEISNTDLRAMVAEHLADRYGEEIFKRYMTSDLSTFTIHVRDHQGRVNTFSLERLARSLDSCALGSKKAKEVADQIHRTLVERRIHKMESIELSRITYQALLDEMDEKTARRYLVWLEFQHSGRPLILLIGGTNGCGKSTVASEIAHRINVVRTQSTDMLREVMRKMVAKRLLPVLHTSSFKAWETLPGRALDDDPERLFIEGYLTQAEHVSVACNGVLRRAMNERASLILEGIHIHPEFARKVSKDNDVIVVPIMLAALKPKQLKEQITGRADRQPTRRAERYLENFDAIWQLQTFLLSEADRCHVPIITNNKIEKTIDQVLETVTGYLMHAFAGDPEIFFQVKGTESSIPTDEA